MTLWELCDLYLQAARIEKGFSRETLRTFRTRISAFIRLVGSEAALADFNLATLKRYVCHLVWQHLRPRTVKACFNASRSFGEHLVEQGALTDNPALRVPFPRLDAVRRELVADDQVCDLLAACDRLRDPSARLFAAR